MSRANYDAMSKGELKQYFLTHRGDRAALQAYLNRLNQVRLELLQVLEILILMRKYK